MPIFNYFVPEFIVLMIFIYISERDNELHHYFIVRPLPKHLLNKVQDYNAYLFSILYGILQ